MTKLKTLSFLMLAVTVFIWSADAASQKQLPLENNLQITSNIDNSVDLGVSENALVQKSAKAATLTEVATENSISNVKAELNAQLMHSNSAFVKNPDGTITAAFKSISNGKGTGNASCSNSYQAGFIPGGSTPPWKCYAGYHSALGGYCHPALYYDISLLPAAAVITDVNVDLAIMPLGTYPTQTLYFDINDLFTLYTSGPPDNYTTTEEDIRNVGGGNTYITETTGLSVTGTYNYDLGTQAETDITTLIAASTTLFGIGMDVSATAAVDGFWLMDASQGAPESILYVTFTAPGNNPVITSVTASPATAENIGMDTITFTATWTDVDDQDLSEFGMIFKYKTIWDEEVQLSGGTWEKTGTGAYSWTGEWDPGQDHQIGVCDVSFMIWDGTFTDTWDYTTNDDLFTITSPAIDYTDFNIDGPLSQWPTGWVDNPTTAPAPPTAISWQYDYRWAGTSDHIAYAHNDDAAQDCYLTSPVVDFTGMATAHLFFDAYWEGTPTSFALEGSIDGFATVADSIELTTTIAADSLESLNWNITSWAAGQSNAQIRFHFVAPASPAAGAIFDVVQFVAGDAPVVVTDTEVTPATGDVIASDSLDFSVDFTGSTTATVDDFTFSIYVQSDVGLAQSLITGLSNGDAYGSVIVQNAPGDFTATLAGMTFLPGIEIGLYDLMGYVSNGIDWDYDDFTDNEDVLTITTESFWYEDFNDTGATGPTGWSILSLPGGENGDDWTYDSYTGTTDFFALIAYDQSSPADPQNEVLRTSVIDCSGKTNCTLYYSYIWASGYDAAATGEVRISNDGGSNFTTIYTHTAPVTPGAEDGMLELDISSYADGEDDVVVEFRYHATDDNYWMVDIVQIDDEPDLPIPSTGPIGLVLLLAAVGGLISRKRK